MARVIFIFISPCPMTRANPASLSVAGSRTTPAKWRTSAQSTAARELRLTNRQYRTLVHQCNALAQAGARDFGTPADWPQAELETYLYYRNQDFHTFADALLMLNIDFTGGTTDWNSLPYFLTYDELNALDFTAPKTDAIPDYALLETLQGDDCGRMGVHPRRRLPDRHVGRRAANISSMSTTATLPPCNTMPARSCAQRPAAWIKKETSHVQKSNACPMQSWKS